MNYDLIFSFITLSFLEIILGIDNLIFIALVVSKLPNQYRKSARAFGLILAFIIRVIMLFTLSWVMTLTEPLFFIAELPFSFKSLLLILGGMFLIGKSGLEIYSDIACKEHKSKEIKVANGLFSAITQITLIDFVFSFDSIITAVGMTNNIPIIVGAVIVSMIVMFLASEKISYFLANYSSLKIVALAFIFMIGVILVSDGLHLKISKNYLYFSLFFTLAVESLNIIARKRKNSH